MVFKLDVQLQQVEGHADAASTLKAGSIVCLRRDADGSLACTSADGAAVGVVPAEHLPQLNTAAHFTGTVRSVRRKAGESNITHLLVRFTAGQPPPASPGPLFQGCDSEDGARLSAEHLRRLAGDDEVRRYLRDERLQDVLRGVDSSHNREAALAAALQGPNFKNFADKVLDVVAPEAS